MQRSAVEQDLTVSEFDTPAEDMPKPVREKRVRQPKQPEVNPPLSRPRRRVERRERAGGATNAGWRRRVCVHEGSSDPPPKLTLLIHATAAKV
jgi:hypothetical protein